MECSVESCLRTPFRGGLCGRHYEIDRRARCARCSVKGCDTPIHAKGFCGPHYRAHLRKISEPCSVEGCSRPRIGQGLCGAHLMRKQRHGFLDPTRPADWGGRTTHPLYEVWQSKKRFHKAGVVPRWLEFWSFVEDVKERPSERHRLFALDQSAPIGPSNFEWREPKISIEKCASNAEYMRIWQRRYREQNPESFARYEYKKRYGLSYDDYQKMLVEQDGKCAICQQPETATDPRTGQPRKLAVDHCHDHGHVRALLCTKCNHGLGAFRDDPALLSAAITYLERHAKLA